MPKDEFGNEVEADEFGNPVEGSAEPEGGALEGMARAGRKMANGAMFGLLPQAGAAIDATLYPLAGEKAQGPTWMDRYRSQRDEYMKADEEDSKKLAHPDIDELVGGLATGGALMKALPWANKVRTLPKVLRAALGIGEASTLNAGIGAAKNFDDPKKALEGAEAGATSPANLLGAAGPLLESLAPLFGKMANSRVWKTLAPAADDVPDLRRAFGDLDTTKKWVLEQKLADGTPLVASGDTPEIFMRKMKMLKDQTGQDKQWVVNMADQMGAKVDVQSVVNGLLKTFQDHNTPGGRVLDPNAYKQATKFFARILDEAGYSGKKPTLLTLSDWEDLKSAIQTKVADRLASSKVNTPLHSMLGEFASTIKSADEEALGKALGPQLAEAFSKVKDQYGKISTLAPLVEKAANTAATKTPPTLLRRVLPLALGAATGGASHSPAAGVAAATAGAALDRAGESFAGANPRMARTYNWLQKHLPEKAPSSVPAALLLKRALGQDQGEEQ